MANNIGSKRRSKDTFAESFGDFFSYKKERDTQILVTNFYFSESLFCPTINLVVQFPVVCPVHK